MHTSHPNAKINIGLNITERRPDGYHNIETIFYPIALQDSLSIGISETCSDYNFSTSGIHIDSDPNDNLIIKALQLLRQDFDIPPVDISLHKQIPFRAGLGGGSSDAAFMLKALNEIFKLNLTTKKLESYAAQIGADCPFFIQNKVVAASGIGNIFEPVGLSLKGYWIVLVKPEIFISTPEAYAGVTPQTTKTPLKELIKSPINTWKNLITNDFEKSVFSKHPLIGKIKDELYHLGALYASMSGSGASVYGIFENEPLYSSLFDASFVVAGVLE